jgi:site-specific recombinase XerD
MATTPDLAELLPSWLRHLRAERKSPKTIQLYQAGAEQYLQWCSNRAPGEIPRLDRASVDGFVSHLLDLGRAPATAHAYQKALRQFAHWLVDEGELDADPLLGIRPPKVDVPVTPTLSVEQLRALVKACEGKTLRDRRDEAMIRLMVETGVRAGECVALKVGDIDLDRGLVLVRRGKGGKGRVIPFGPQCARSLDRYLRARRAHPRAAEAPLWVGEGGHQFGYHGLSRALKRRAAMAGLQGFTPHVLRHTAAARWLAKGGSEGGLMAVAGWARRDMIDRYVIAVRSELAAQEARELGLGDDL